MNSALILIFNETVIDGWSMEIFMEELSELYAAHAAGREAHLSEQSFQFSDFRQLAAPVVRQ